MGIDSELEYPIYAPTRSRCVYGQLAIVDSLIGKLDQLDELHSIPTYTADVYCHMYFIDT